jgi:hypothetical protein
MKLNNLHDIFNYCNINNAKRIGIIFATPKLAEEGRQFYLMLFGSDALATTYIYFTNINSQICGVQLDEILVYQDNTLADSYTVQELHDVITTSFLPRLRRPTFDNVQVINVR